MFWEELLLQIVRGHRGTHLQVVFARGLVSENKVLLVLPECDRSFVVRVRYTIHLIGFLEDLIGLLRQHGGYPICLVFVLLHPT